MTTTDPSGGYSPGGDAFIAGGTPTPGDPTSPVPPPIPPRRMLRRSRNDRFGAGVAGGLGEYFGLDPVLFRVLFATAAFFGGAGVLAYALAWAVIPEEGTEHAAIDGWIAQLRRRHVPVWLVAVAGGVILWAVAFSWWMPGPFLPVLVVVIVLVVLFGRRGGGVASDMPPDGVPTGAESTPSEPERAGRPVNLSKERTTADGGPPPWADSARAWVQEARAASRERRRRAFPVKMTILGVLVATLIVFGVADAVGGIVLPAYFWATGIILALGLLVGVALRRTPWSMAPLLVPVLAGLIAFGNTGASLHDGVGQHDWTPLSASGLAPEYRLAFGQGVLDLRQLGPLDRGRVIEVTMAAGRLKVLLPDSLNATVNVEVRIGQIQVDGVTVADTEGGSIHRVSGYDISRLVTAPAGATGPRLGIDVHLADGNVSVEHTR